MSRSSPPIEILLGFGAGLIAGLLVEEPLLWFLHLFGLTNWRAFTTAETPPLGIEAFWAHVLWGGAFGMALAWFGTRYSMGLTWFRGATLSTLAVRSILDWFIVPMFQGRAGIGFSVDAILTPLILNSAWAVATAGFLAAASIAMARWGSRSPL